jgi:hypothetical protein
VKPKLIETYKGRSITYIKASGLYVISDAPLGPQVRVAFSTAHARKIVDGMISQQRRILADSSVKKAGATV